MNAPLCPCPSAQLPDSSVWWRFLIGVSAPQVPQRKTPGTQGPVLFPESNLVFRAVPRLPAPSEADGACAAVPTIILAHNRSLHPAPAEDLIPM